MFTTAHAATTPTGTTARTATVRHCTRVAGTAALAGALLLGSAAMAGTATAAGMPATTPPAPTPSLDLAAAPVTPPPGPGDLADAPQTPPPGPGDLADAPVPPGPDPMPTPGVTLADAPPVASGHTITSFGPQIITDVSMQLRWDATAPTTVLQISRHAPSVAEGGRLSMSTSPIPVSGEPLASGGGEALTSGATTYRSIRVIDGLRPDTEYFVLVTVPVGPGYRPVQRVQKFSTKVRHVSVEVSGITVISDSDKGFRGRGELEFQPRIAPADPMKWAAWGDRSSVLKLGDGDKAWFNPMLRHQATTRDSRVVVQVQGCDQDAIDEDRCILESEDKPQQGDWLGQDMAFAEGVFDLPTTRYKWTHTQQRTIEVQRTPDLRFTAKVIVTVWYK